MTSLIRRGLMIVAAIVMPALAPLAHADTIKIGYSEALSGVFAQVGDQGIKSIQYAIDGVNARGGVLGKQLELVPMDNKGQPSEALITVQKMLDENISIMMNCGPSNIASALIGAVEKNNERNPNRRILHINCGGLAPELTNEQCSFWHFRTSAHAGMQAEIMVRALPKDVTKVYLINQDYLFGQSAQRDLKLYLAKLRPDVQIMGEEMIPLGKVKDFSSYIQKIKASGAQALVTGNWGPDLTLLIKAGMETGLPIDYYTMLAHLAGTPTAIGPGGDGRVHSVLSFHENVPAENNDAARMAWVEAFRAKNNFDYIFGDRWTAVELIARGIEKAKSTDPMQVALALEGITVTDTAGKPATIRPEDHQIQMTYYGAIFSKGVKYDSEKTGLGWKTEKVVSAADVNQASTCKMKRPAS
ncbi:MAG: branched-chain amino acid ABC transporter substrate-binding protein [Proteobacteria bacterium]|nr:branched-chain amino acid ABC transporter substrate-binding protein [Pseudomonadota bacterium]